jgi:hypothetical protein
MRDEFSQRTRTTLAKRSGHRCSNPERRIITSGPHLDPDKSINIGVAAHITAAASGGKRYNAYLSSAQRASSWNGIWLCQTCAHLIDTDEQRFSEEQLHHWKTQNEREVFAEMSGRSKTYSPNIFQGVRVEVSVVSSGSKKSSLLLVKVLNRNPKTLLIKSIRIKVIEFACFMPFGSTKHSNVYELDIGKLRHFGSRAKINLNRIVEVNDRDEFSLVLSAPSLGLLRAAWKLDIDLFTNLGISEIGEKEVFIPGGEVAQDASYFKVIRRNIRKSVEAGKAVAGQDSSNRFEGWIFKHIWPRLFTKSFFHLRGFVCFFPGIGTYWGGIGCYSGPYNIFKNHE